MSSLRSNITIQPQEIFTSSATQGTDLGALATTGDGRFYRYVSVGSTTALVTGKLVQTPIEKTAFENLSIAASAVGALTVVTTSTVTCAANQFAGGFLAVSVNPGGGFLYKIKSHAAATAAAITFNLEDSIQVALTTTSKIDVIENPFSGVIINPVTFTGTPVGVAVAPLSAGQYGWVQTHGPCAVFGQGAIAVGAGVTPSIGTAGAVASWGGTTVCLGTAMTAISDTEAGNVFLELD